MAGLFRAILLVSLVSLASPGCSPAHAPPSPSEASSVATTPGVATAEPSFSTAGAAAADAEPGSQHSTPPEPGVQAPLPLKVLPVEPFVTQALVTGTIGSLKAGVKVDAAIVPVKLPRGQRGIAWLLKLDHHDAQQVRANVSEVPLSWLYDELQPPRSGVHQLTLFALDTSGKLLHRANGMPVVVQKLFSVDGEMIAQATPSRQPVVPVPVVVLTPNGTLNNASTSALLQFTGPTDSEFILRISDDLGRSFERRVRGRVHALVSLENRDYSIVVGVAGTDPKTWAAATVTVNLDAPEQVPWGN